MVKTRFTKLDPEYLARVGPVGPDGQEVPLHLVYDKVMPAARISQETIIRLRHIYNFLLFHANIIQFSHIFGNFLYDLLD